MLNLLSDFLELLYPTLCPGCGEVSDPETVWCEACLRKVWNPRLLETSYMDHLTGCYTLTNYDGAIRESLLRLKYHGDKAKKRIFPPLLSRFPWWDRLADMDLAMPVPLAKKRLQQRGYNQVDIIFQPWMESHGWTYLPDGLVRFRSGGTQHFLSREERFTNMKDIFHINRGVDVKGKQILLLDDIYTTGATMEAVAHELKRAGAAKVVGLTIASGAI